MATTAVALSDRHLVASSRAILTGEVQKITSQRHQGNIYTYVGIDVEESLKGPFREGQVVVLRQLGGTVGEVTSTLAGAPRFREGDRVLLFLDTWSDGALRVAHLFFGKYDLVVDEDTGVVRAERRASVQLLPRKGVRSTASADFEVFRREVQRWVRETAGRELTPVRALEQPAEYGGRRGDRGLSVETSPFQLLPNHQGLFWRWFEADSGQAVITRVNPANAPVADFRDRTDRALSTWTQAPLNNRIWNNASPSVAATSSLILQRGADIFTAFSPRRFDGFTHDGVSVISYNDPLGQLQDPSGCEGILAASLYINGTADTRVVNGVRFNRLLENDIVFNNGWIGCGFLENSVTFEEITLHEVGHSIGLGHSEVTSRAPGDNPAMQAFVHANGRGAKLGLDDLVGVTFIYPGAGNPIDEAAYYVGFHYRDFLEREPDFGGWNFWTRTITDCVGCSVAAQRIHLARAFLYSGEFIDLEQSQDPFNRRRLDASNRGTPDYNEAFVDACYRRYWKTSRPATDPWVGFLNANIPNNDGHYNTVIEAFITDSRYRGRFGTP
ncbi:MAG TPA: hypothetical protein VE685_23805 [Thermoanaerobaculia bacterium]|nr:hypothetical protein [Thermoanaerobaculia bacterium]